MLWSSTLHAQAAPGTTLSLSDADKADLLSHNTEASVDAARAGLGDAPSGARKIHGEIGAVIGSNGTRGTFGTAAIPLGANAGAIVSFEAIRSNRH